MGLPVLSGLVEDLLRALVGRIGPKVKVGREVGVESRLWRRSKFGALSFDPEPPREPARAASRLLATNPRRRRHPRATTVIPRYFYIFRNTLSVKQHNVKISCGLKLKMP